MLHTIIQNSDIDKEEESFLKDLKKVDVTIHSVWDLVNGPNNYDHAIPVLIKHLAYNYSDRFKEGIVRALTLPSARGLAAVPLIKLFREYNDMTTVGIKWAIGNALSVVATAKELQSLIELVQDKSNGLSRCALVRPIFRYGKKDPQVIRLLQKIAQEKNEVGQEAHKILAKFKLNKK